MRANGGGFQAYQNLHQATIPDPGLTEQEGEVAQVAQHSNTD